MIADIIIVAIIIVFAVIGVRRGIARTLLGVVGIFVTVSLSYLLSEFLSQFIYDTFVKETVVNNINEFITQNGIDFAVSNCLSALPDWVYGIVSFVVSIFGVNIGQFENNMNIITGEAVSSASTAIEEAVGSVAVSVFQLFLVIILFIVLYILVRKLIKMALRVFEIPVIKQVNGFLGGILGAVEGMIFAWVAVNLFYAIILLTSPDTATDSLVCGELFRFFCIAL